MKKFILTIFVAAFIFMGFNVPYSVAGSVVDKGYEITINNVIYEAYFEQGPFSGGIGGLCKLYINDKFVDDYAFQQYDDIVYVKELGDYVVIENKLRQVTKWGIELTEITP